MKKPWSKRVPEREIQRAARALRHASDCIERTTDFLQSTGSPFSSQQLKELERASVKVRGAALDILVELPIPRTIPERLIRKTEFGPDRVLRRIRMGRGKFQ